MKFFSLNKLNYSQKIIIFLFIAVSILNIFTVLWGMPNFASWSVDDQSGIHTLAFFKTWDPIKYPALGYILNIIFYIPLLMVSFLTKTFNVSNIKYPNFGFSNPDIQISGLIIVSRLLNFSSYLLSGYMLYKAIKPFSKKVAFFSSFAYLLSPLPILFSTTGNIDGLMMLFVSICFYFLSKLFYHKEEEGYKIKKIWIMFFLSLAGLSAIKEAGVFTFVLPCLFVMFKLKYFSRKNFKRILSEFIPAFLIYLAAFIIFNNILFNFSGYVLHLQAWIGGPAIHGYGNYALLELLKRTFIATALSSPIVAVLFFVGAIKGFSNKKNLFFLFFILLFPLSFFIFSIYPVKFVFLRFTLINIFFFSIFAGVAINYISKNRILTTILFLILISFSIVPIYKKFTDSRYTTEKKIIKISEDKNISTYSGRFFVYLPRINKLKNNPNFKANEVSQHKKIEEINQEKFDLLIMVYKNYQKNKNFLKNYKIIYDSLDKTPYYHKLRPDLSPCRISCRTIILEKNKE